MPRVSAGALILLCVVLIHVGSGSLGSLLGAEALTAPFRLPSSLQSASGAGAAGAGVGAVVSPLEQVTAAAWARMRASIEADRYVIRAPAGASGSAIYEAHNPDHDLRATFLLDGVRVRSSREGEADWEWSLQLERFGYEGVLETVENVAPVAGGNRVEYRRAALTEWYVNDPAGLEQGFTVAAPPSSKMKTGESGTTLVVELRAAGLRTRQDVARKSILLEASDGAEVLHYRGLIAWDAEGTSLPAEMRATGEGIRIEVDARGANYPLTIDPFIESAILRASDAQANDGFGFSVAVSGDTAIVGAWREDGGAGDPISDAGAAYIFDRNQGGTDNWGEAKKLTASDAQTDDFFGKVVAISGDTALVTADGEDGGTGDPLPLAGAAYLFARNLGGADNWGEVAKLTASDAQAGDQFGSSAAIAADTAIVGALSEDGGVGDPTSGSGAAYVFGRDQGGPDNWGEVARLASSDAQVDDQFGISATISGDTVLVGATGEDGGAGDPIVAAGAAYLYERNQGGADNWGEVKKLSASDAQPGDEFANSVSISADTTIVGARLEDGGSGDPLIDAGAAYIFERDQGGAANWGEAAKLTAFDAQGGDEFGFSVAISTDAAVVGAHAESNFPNPDAGAAYVFERDRGGTGNWGQIKKLSASDGQPEDAFGNDVAISSGTVIVGAWNEAGGAGSPVPFAGAAYVFDQTAWAAWAFVLDGFGGLHAAGHGVVPISPAPPYFGFDIARDLELSGDGAYVLDGFGAVHTAGPSVVPLNPAPPYFGFDVARDLELEAGGGAYVLDGWGGVHAVGGAPVISPATSYFGFDIARDLEIGGGGYYVLDGFGGAHAAGGVAAISPPFFGFDAAQDLELPEGGGGYMLDKLGRVHAFTGAPVLWPPTPFFGFDVARDLELEPGSHGHFVLDGFGGLHAGSGALPITPAPPFFGFDIARDVELR